MSHDSFSSPFSSSSAVAGGGPFSAPSAATACTMAHAAVTASFFTFPAQAVRLIAEYAAADLPVYDGSAKRFL